MERTTRFTMLLHLPPMEGHGVQPRVKNGPPLAGHGAEAVRDAIVAAITQLPEELRRSLTWDQGAEMAQHAQLRIDADLQVFFCDPHSPWQRGTNENTNGLLRQYFPKGTDLSQHSTDDLAAVALTLNTRPRKTLGWRTPAEALNEYPTAARGLEQFIMPIRASSSECASSSGARLRQGRCAPLRGRLPPTLDRACAPAAAAPERNNPKGMSITDRDVGYRAPRGSSVATTP